MRVLRAEAHDYFGGRGCGVEWLWRLRWLVVLRGAAGEICRAYASDDAIKVDFMIKVKERAIGMGNRRRA
jgi:hypothetical protein